MARHFFHKSSTRTDLHGVNFEQVTEMMSCIDSIVSDRLSVPRGVSIARAGPRLQQVQLAWGVDNVHARPEAAASDALGSCRMKIIHTDVLLYGLRVQISCRLL